MRDILGWSCEDGCQCEKEGHIHFDDPRLRPKPKTNWWNRIFKQ